MSDLARKQLGGRGREEQELPAHYYEWAATLSDLPPDQRATVLNTLPEDDRLHVQVSLHGKARIAHGVGVCRFTKSSVQR